MDNVVVPTNAPEQPTLRDRFAMAALTGLLADPNEDGKDVAKRAYQFADAMLEARKVPPKATA